MPAPARSLAAVNRLRSLRYVLALVLVLNAFGSSMAWAHFLGGGPDSQPAAAEMAPGCHDADTSTSSHSDPGGMPCCDDGSCTCAAAALLTCGSPTAAHLPPATSMAPADTPALPTHPLDDTLRPPIR